MDRKGNGGECFFAVAMDLGGFRRCVQEDKDNIIREIIIYSKDRRFGRDL